MVLDSNTSGVEIRLYPDYDHFTRMIARIEVKGVRITIMQGYDAVIRTDFIPDIALDKFLIDMTSGKHPVGKIAYDYRFKSNAR